MFLSFSVELVHFLNTIVCLFLQVSIKVMSLLFLFILMCGALHGWFLYHVIDGLSLLLIIFWWFFSDYMGLLVKRKEWCVLCFRCFARNLQEALSDPKWRTTMQEEMKTLPKNKTCDLVKLPNGKKVVGCKWVFTIKHKADGYMERYKASLVAKSFTQT
jgi:hypothetical protein